MLQVVEIRMCLNGQIGLLTKEEYKSSKLINWKLVLIAILKA